MHIAPLNKMGCLLRRGKERVNTGQARRCSSYPCVTCGVGVSIRRLQLGKLRLRGPYEYKTTGTDWNSGLTNAKAEALE